MQSQPDDPEIIDPKIYQDCGAIDVVQQKYNDFLRQFNEDDN